MDPNQRTSKASKIASEDFISNMPDFVVTNILDRLPLQDVVKTSILSRNWRFKWAIVSQLVFDAYFNDFIREKTYEESYESIISRLLLNHKDALTKFFIYIEDKCYDEDIAHWIFLLSRKEIKDLIIWNTQRAVLKLPTHFFSCLELKYLELNNCCIDPPDSFHGFPNLLSLELGDIEFKSRNFGDFFTQCPVLEILNLGLMYSYPAKVKLVEIAKFKNLRILALCLGRLVDTMITSSSVIFEIVGGLPKLQELDLDFTGCKFTKDGARKRSPTTFPCLVALELSSVDLGNDIMLSFAFELIRSSPNLQTLDIYACKQDVEPPPAICSLDLNYNTMGLLQLRRVFLTNLKGLENEVCLIDNLLACSPFLKKVVILVRSTLGPDEKLKFARKLLKIQRASPIAEIELK